MRKGSVELMQPGSYSESPFPESRTMFLTPDQLHELTDYKRAADQIRWLREKGYPFEIGASGRPKVLSSMIEIRLQAKGGPKLRFA